MRLSRKRAKCIYFAKSAWLLRKARQGHAEIANPWCRGHGLGGLGGLGGLTGALMSPYGHTKGFTMGADAVVVRGAPVQCVCHGRPRNHPKVQHRTEALEFLWNEPVACPWQRWDSGSLPQTEIGQLSISLQTKSVPEGERGLPRRSEFWTRASGVGHRASGIGLVGDGPRAPRFVVGMLKDGDGRVRGRWIRGGRGRRWGTFKDGAGAAREGQGERWRCPRGFKGARKEAF
jgi:hypothetical protein